MLAELAAELEKLQDLIYPRARVQMLLETDPEDPTPGRTRVYVRVTWDGIDFHVEYRFGYPLPLDDGLLQFHMQKIAYEANTRFAEHEVGER